MSETIMRGAGSFDLQRRVVSHMTVESWRTVPHVAFVYEPDVTNFLARFSAEEGEPGANPRVTINTLMLKVIAEGLKAAPLLNAYIAYHHLRGEGRLEPQESINLAVPWLLPDGRMITPTVRDCGNLSLPGMAGAVEDIRRRLEATDVDELLYSAIVDDTLRRLGRLDLGVLPRVLALPFARPPVRGLSGKQKRDYDRRGPESHLTKEDLLDATVSVSNVGSLYKGLRGSFAMLQIVPPQVFAVGIGAIQEGPGLDGGRRSRIPLTLVFDHRAVDFGDLIPFIKALDGIFENPESLLAQFPVGREEAGLG